MADNSFKVKKLINLEPQASAPTPGAKGDFYVDTSGNGYIHNGTAYSILSTGTPNLDALGQVTITTPLQYHVLQYNGSVWVNSLISNDNIVAAANISDTKLAQLTTASKVSLSAITPVTTSRVIQSNSSTGLFEASSVTNTELGYLSGVTSSVLGKDQTGTLTNKTYKAVDGSISNPSITFENDNNTGIYLKGSGQTSFTSNGVEIMHTDGSGIGSTSQGLVVRGDGNTRTGKIRIHSATTRYGELYYSDGLTLEQVDTNDELFIKAPTGRGIYNRIDNVDIATITSTGLNLNNTALTNAIINADSNTITNIENADIKVGANIDAAKIGTGLISNTEFNYLNDVSSSILGKDQSGTLTNKMYRAVNGSAAAPSVTFDNHTGSGLYVDGSGNLGLCKGGAYRAYVSDNGIVFANGSVSTPSISFDGDTDTGLYRYLTNQIAMSLGGLRRLTFTNNTCTLGTGDSGTEADTYFRVLNPNAAGAESRLLLSIGGASSEIKNTYNGSYALEISNLYSGSEMIFKTNVSGTMTEQLKMNNTGVIPRYQIATGTAIGRNTTGGYLTNSTSSIKYKKNVVDINTNIDYTKIYDLRVVEFDYKNDPVYAKPRKEVGLIAEEVEQILPNLVAYDQQGEPESVYYQDLHVLSLKALQDQKNIIEQQQTLIDSLISRIEALENK